MGPAGEPLQSLAEGEEYELSADARRSRFVLRCKTERKAADLSGEDAARLAADYETVQAQFPEAPADRLLAQLWDQGGYSWLAAAEEE